MNTIPLQSANRRSGFTLVEMLVVITIIGILAALLIPAISGIVKKGKETAIAMEVDGLAQAIEQYNNTYGDYPPDFSDTSVVRSHFRRIRPQILQTDIAIAEGLCGQITRAQALVLVLGGYSDDQKRPLTGVGGPFANFDASLGQYRFNPDRTNKLFDFELGRLNFESSPTLPTILPTFSPSGLQQPYVYFDSRTYGLATVNNSSTWNAYFGSGDAGVIRAYKTREQPRLPSKGLGSSYSNKQEAMDGFRYQKADTFQVISAGLDDIYGAVWKTDNGDPVYYVSEYGSAVYPNESDPVQLASGEQRNEENIRKAILRVLLFKGISGFQESSESRQNVNGHLDNITNFFSGRLDDQLVEL